MAFRLVAVDNPGHGGWEREQALAEDLHGSFTLTEYESFLADPIDCDALVNGGGWPLSSEILDQLPQCRFIVTFGSGMDWIDIEDASARGILLARTPSANVEDVATHALALMLACVRRLPETDEAIRAGEFPSALRPIHRLGGRRVGLLSFGQIPRRLVELIAPFGAEIRAHDPHVPDDEIRANGAEPVDFDELLRTSDVLSVHTPASAATEGLLNERMELLPLGAVVIITSRGAVYDPAVLIRLLETGHIAAAGLDVFPVEPVPIGHPLLSAPRTILTPHIAGYSEEAVRDYHVGACRAVVAFARGEVPDGLVNEANLATVGHRGSS